MQTEEYRAECISRFTTAVFNVAGELVRAGIEPERLAAALRIRTASIEAQATRAPVAPDEREMLDLAARVHEFVNTLQVAGIGEEVAVSTLANVGIERVARTHGAAGAAHWLRRLAAMVDQDGDAIETCGRAH